MQDQSVSESGPQIMNAIRVRTVQFRKLFRNDLDRQILELEGKGDNFVIKVRTKIKWTCTLDTETSQRLDSYCLSSLILY